MASRHTTDADNDEEMILMSDYSYNLKNESIARFPASPRGSSKLLRVDGSGKVKFYPNFSDIFPSLCQNCHLVFNDSHVLDARLFVQHNNKKMELMILDLGEVDLEAPCQETILRAMIRTCVLTKGDILRDTTTGVSVKVESISGIWQEDETSDGNGLDCLVKIQCDTPLDAYLDEAGSVPIPPYFQRESEEKDKESYNNVYAAASGSVAAPTAGLHFTHQLLDKLGKGNISFLTLHVGAGTFQPVLKENASEHDMHAESFVVSVIEIKRIIKCIQAEQPIMVVGTTSCRTLESLYWCGVKLLLAAAQGGAEETMDTQNLELGQFEWKALRNNSNSSLVTTPQEALQALVDSCQEGESVVKGRTRLMIYPPVYKFRVVHHLVTNFHAPDSTLMLLVCAFMEHAEKIQSVYHDAQEQGYRFLSYGDVCLFSQPGYSLPVDAADEA